MTPLQLYLRAPESADHEIGNLWGHRYNHVPELGDGNVDLPWVDPNARVELRYYKNFCFDGRRIWRLASAWFLDLENNEWEPFMCIQNAGREGDDHGARFITNPKIYGQVVRYLASLNTSGITEVTDIVDPLKDIPDLTSFYGNTLDGNFTRSYY